MRADTVTVRKSHSGFEAEFDEAIRLPSEAAANAMLARGRYIVYREADTPRGHVVREYPDGTKETVKVDLNDATHQA
jgi:hypothetical protein